MSQLVFCLCWNPEEAGSNANEGMNVLTMSGQAGEEQELPSSMSLHQFPAGGMAHIKGMSSHLKIRIKVVCLSTSNVWTRNELTYFKPSRKSLTAVRSISGLWFIPDVVKLTIMNSHHRKERRGEGRGADGKRRGEERKVPGMAEWCSLRTLVLSDQMSALLPVVKHHLGGFVVGIK